MASIETFVDEVAAVTLTSAVRQYTYPPRHLNTADLPASYVMPPSSTYEIVATCDGVNDTFVVVWVVATEAVGQNRQPQNFEAMVQMMDEINAALKAATFTDMLPPTWTLTAQDNAPIIVADTAYWGVTATITAQSGA